MPEIQLVKVGNVDADVVDYLALTLGDNLGLTCRVLSRSVDVSGCYNPARQQYSSMDILLGLARLEASPDSKVLGLASVDLFIPILTFVFGQAQLNNRNALMSTYRLNQGYYGLPEDEELFYDRCEKEALHEIGHTFGLLHCHRFDCIMYLSNAIDQVDLKSNRFCDSCRGLLQSAGVPSPNF